MFQTQTTCYVLSAMCYVPCYVLRATCYVLSAMCYVPCYVLRAACYVRQTLAFGLRMSVLEVTVNRKTYGILAGIIGSALGAWLYRSRLMKSSYRTHAIPARERGQVIFDNTPTASDSNAI